MKIIFTGKLGVVEVNSSVLMLVPFMLLKLKSKTPNHCGDIHIHFCVFCERVAPSCRKLTVVAVFTFVLSIGQFISAYSKASHISLSLSLSQSILGVQGLLFQF